VSKAKVFLKARTKEFFQREYIQLFKLHCILFSWSKTMSSKSKKMGLSKCRQIWPPCIWRRCEMAAEANGRCFFLSGSDNPRVENAKLPSSVKLEYCYYKLTIPPYTGSSL
jgi:hypothetical protein